MCTESRRKVDFDLSVGGLKGTAQLASGELLRITDLDKWAALFRK